ncbi:MAG: hypothetical protein HQK52_22970 [Oligoflexia bacterium]|nr:hypothetical protein [Oligoflexia bacterium]
MLKSLHVGAFLSLLLSMTSSTFAGTGLETLLGLTKSCGGNESFVNPLPVIEENETSFQLNYAHLAKGGLQVSVTITDASEQEYSLKEYKDLDLDNIFSQGNKMFVSKVAFIIEDKIDRVIKKISDPLEYQKRVFPCCFDVEPSCDYDSSFKSCRNIQVGSINLGTTTFHVKQVNDLKNTPFAKVLKIPLNKKDNDELGTNEGPRYTVMATLKNSSDNRVAGGQTLLKFYPIGDRQTLVISYRIGSISINRMLFRLAKSIAYSIEIAETVDMVNNFRSYVRN